MIDIDKDFDAWWQLNRCGTNGADYRHWAKQGWLAAKRHAAQVDSVARDAALYEAWEACQAVMSEFYCSRDKKEQMGAVRCIDAIDALIRGEG